MDPGAPVCRTQSLQSASTARRSRSLPGALTRVPALERTRKALRTPDRRPAGWRRRRLGLTQNEFSIPGVRLHLAAGGGRRDPDLGKTRPPLNCARSACDGEVRLGRQSRPHPLGTGRQRRTLPAAVPLGFDRALARPALHELDHEADADLEPSRRRPPRQPRLDGPHHPLARAALAGGRRRLGRGRQSARNLQGRTCSSSGWRSPRSRSRPSGSV